LKTQGKQLSLSSSNSQTVPPLNAYEEITRRLDRFMVWSFSTTVTVGGLVVAILKLWN